MRRLDAHSAESVPLQRNLLVFNYIDCIKPRQFNGNNSRVWKD